MRSVVVTGASTGIGHASVKLLLDKGFKVFGSVRKAADADRLKLRAAQRLWIAYRDANCLYFGMGEGTIARVGAAECMRSMTEARARELETLGRQ
jgi:uncharacterized protein YecT (DUF1311 family)